MTIEECRATLMQSVPLERIDSLTLPCTMASTGECGHCDHRRPLPCKKCGGRSKSTLPRNGTGLSPPPPQSRRTTGTVTPLPGPLYRGVFCDRCHVTIGCVAVQPPVPVTPKPEIQAPVAVAPPPSKLKPTGMNVAGYSQLLSRPDSASRSVDNDAAGVPMKVTNTDPDDGGMEVDQEETQRATTSEVGGEQPAIQDPAISGREPPEGDTSSEAVPKSNADTTADPASSSCLYSDVARLLQQRMVHSGDINSTSGDIADAVTDTVAPSSSNEAAQNTATGVQSNVDRSYAAVWNDPSSPTVSRRSSISAEAVEKATTSTAQLTSSPGAQLTSSPGVQLTSSPGVQLTGSSPAATTPSSRRFPYCPPADVHRKKEEDQCTDFWLPLTMSPPEMMDVSEPIAQPDSPQYHQKQEDDPPKLQEEEEAMEEVVVKEEEAMEEVVVVKEEEEKHLCKPCTDDEHLVQSLTPDQINIIVDVIKMAVADKNIFFFGEILELPQVHMLKNTRHENYVNLLRLFAYGTLSDYLNRRQDYQIELTQSEIHKLRKLTLLSCCADHSVIFYKSLKEKLFLDTNQQVEEIIVECIYSDLVNGRLNQLKEEFYVMTFMARDISDPRDLIDLLNAVNQMSDNCDRVLKEINDCNKYVKDAIQAKQDTYNEISLHLEAYDEITKKKGKGTNIKPMEKYKQKKPLSKVQVVNSNTDNDNNSEVESMKVD